jgi:hypothetical protein
LVIARKKGGEVVARYELGAGATVFSRVKAGAESAKGVACRAIAEGALTHDLRLD